MPANYPPYINGSVDIPVIYGPYLQKNSNLAAFLLKSDLKQLQKLCDTYLNIPGQDQFHYRPLLPYSFLIYSKMEISSLDEEDKNMGWSIENDAGFWILTAAYKPSADGKTSTFDHLVWFLPYLFVDNSFAVPTGREVYGFRKMFSTFKPFQTITDPTFSVETLAYKTFGPNIQAQQYPVLEIRRSQAKADTTSEVAQPASQDWTDSREAIDGILKFITQSDDTRISLDSLNIVINLLNFFTKGVPLVFLKQTPYIGNTRQASYQAIVEAPAVPTAFHGGGILFKKYELAINNLASEPIIADMGLTATPEGVVDVIASAWVNIDFVMEQGVEIWRAPFPKQKIAVLGGGIGSLSAVYGLTNQPNWQELYDITVYQMGWRLGGKGASGRNQAADDRIEEHGLHIWFGFYQAAFNMIQKCYAELNRPDGAPLQKWDDAFKPLSYIVLEDYYKGKWEPWAFNFPTNDSVPGQGGAEKTILAIVKDIVKWLKGEFLKLIPQGMLSPALLAKMDQLTVSPLGLEGSLPPELLTETDQPTASPTNMLLGDSGTVTDGSINVATQYGSETTSESQKAAFYIDETSRLLDNLDEETLKGTEDISASIDSLGADIEGASIDSLGANTENLDLRNIESWIKAFQDTVRGIYDLFERIGVLNNSSVRHDFIILQLGTAMVRGMLHDNLLTGNFSRIDHYDFYEWLEKSGGATPDIAHCAIVRGLYDALFAYPKGDTGVKEPEPTTKGNLAAGSALQTSILILTYKGAITYKMQAGMGDVVFTPIYQVLRRRGVKFKFFHKITQVVPDTDQTIKEIIFDKQVTLKNYLDDDQYQPLIDVNGLPCWPDKPLYNQITQGRQLQARKINLESYWSPWESVEKGLVLKKGKDFDQVVLGISIGALGDICKEIAAQNVAWRNMLANVQTIQTQAIQLWLKPNLQGLGWKNPSPILTSYGQPISSWADMTQTEPHEDWPTGKAPQNVSYFCGPMQDAAVIPPYSDHSFPYQELARVQETAHSWLNKYIAALWPEAVNPDGSLNWNLVMAQYYRANIDPTERYVLTVQASNQYRLKPGGSGYSNLFLAGDWTDNGLNIGAIEPTVRSGLQASQAICGYPRHIPSGILQINK
jgi:uncharacterized protein with NAD-binding domain and iron-sulfur cluster